MKMGWWKTVGLGAGLAALALMAAATDTFAQTVDGDCRCVDADGNAIENCTCFVMPDVPAMPEVMAWGPDGDFALSFSSARPRLGVSVSTGQEDSYDAQGAHVTRVMEGGPAAEAGIREGDVITSVGGRSLLETLEGDAEAEFDLDESIPVQRLLAIARELEPGESVEVAYLRDGARRTAAVEVRDLAGMWGAWAEDFSTQFQPRMEQFRREFQPRMEEMRERLREQSEARGERDMLREVIVRSSGGSTARYGFRITELTPGLGDYFGVEQGALVTDVDEGSALGLRPGDVLLRIGDREVTSASRAARILASYDEGESVTFRVLRDGGEVDVMGSLDD